MNNDIDIDQIVKFTRYRDDNSSIQNRVPKSNKERAKEHRNRKKAYYGQLEEKISTLEDRIKELTDENKSLKDELDKLKTEKSESGNTKGSIPTLLKEESKSPQIPKVLKVSPSQLRFTMVDDTKARMCNYGYERIQCLKNPFRTILENLLPLETKVLIACFDNFSVQKFVNIFKEKKRIK